MKIFKIASLVAQISVAFDILQRQTRKQKHKKIDKKIEKKVESTLWRKESQLFYAMALIYILSIFHNYIELVI